MTLEGNSSTLQLADDAYLLHTTREVATLEPTSTATTCAPASHLHLPQEEALHLPCSSSRETHRDAIDVNSPSASPLEDVEVEWDVARDNETLRLFSYNRLNLVLDSMLPHIAPHIVITPAEETWEDKFVPWQNRVDPQWPYYLCVPPLDFSTGRMLVLEPHPCQPFLETQTDPSSSNAIQDPPVALNSPSFFFSPSIFNHSARGQFQDEIRSCFLPYLQQNSLASHGCKILTDEMVITQKALCKATFFATSDVAHVFRKRYDSQPNVLSSLEPPFTWTDPAEPVLIANRRMLGAIILDSICPFLTPHIIINSPPPQPYQLTENNTTPYTQDAAFGDRLIVEAYFTNIINEVEDTEHYSSYVPSTDTGPFIYDASTVDLLESTTDSRPGSPLPETPVDDDDDRSFYFARNDHEELKGDDLAIHPSIYGVSSPVLADLYTEKLQTTSRWMFYIEEDDDELPSLDDW
ncbi:hypothetical protein C0995_005430 [Termitomyces sp. Mi166|nr:hypothetical protein C0995_005430 [Termitomyces sp. Mi166\